MTMALETATYISDLVTTNPTSTDPKSQGDDHIRLVKAALKTTLPNITGAVSATHTELSYSSGVTSAIQTQINAKAPIASPTFTGTVTVPTPSNSTDASTKGYVDSTAFSTALPAQTGNSGKFVTTNGTTASWSTVEKIPSVAVITSTTTWTCPANVTKAKVYVTGGGGSAGNGVSQNGGGGGGGGTAIKFLTVTPGTVYTATIGAGGTAIASGAGNTTGNAGGTSSFSGSGITTITASGGNGGAQSSSGGNGGDTFAGHDIGMNGGNGHAATSNNGSPQPLGGSSFWAGASPQGIAGKGWGNGGGGLYNNIGGPAGASGVVVIEY